MTSLANVYLANKTAIAPVLRALFTSAEFAASIGQKTRRPIEDVIGAARTLGITPAAGDSGSLSGLYWLLGQMGHAPLAWPLPNGYPDVAEAWLSAGGMMRRWNAHLGLVGGWWTDGMTMPAASTLLGANPPGDDRRRHRRPRDPPHRSAARRGAARRRRRLRVLANQRRHRNQLVRQSPAMGPGCRDQLDLEQPELDRTMSPQIPGQRRASEAPDDAARHRAA